MKDIEQKHRAKHLKAAFERRDYLLRQIALEDAYINNEGRKYWNHLGYTAMPRIEKLRQALGV